MVPEPASPQSLNRYAYVLGNSLRYTDPTGHYSEEEIMQAFGVETWEDVLTHFEDGGALSGLWGWLEVLRRAQDGNFASYDMALRFKPPQPATEWTWGAPYNGGLFSRNAAGRILVSGQPHTSFANAHRDVYSLWQQDVQSPSVWGSRFVTGARTKHYHTQFYAERFDWIDAGCDVLGIASDVFSVLQPVALGADVLSIARSVYNRYENPHDIDATLDLSVEILPKAAGMMPEVGSLYDLQSLVLNLSHAVESTP